VREVVPKGRLEAFSDSVIAIVITLLVLEIRIPQLPQHAGNREVMKVLTQLVPSCAAYLISFAVCAVWWVAHHNFIHDLREVNRQLLWANNLFLLWLALLPLPTALLGQNLKQPVVCALYGAVGVLTGSSFCLMRWYASGRGALMKPDIPLGEVRRKVRISFLSPCLYLVGAATSFIDPRIALSLYAAIAGYFAVVGMRSNRNAEPC
jgi:uncharacterized membrane protein